MRHSFNSVRILIAICLAAASGCIRQEQDIDQELQVHELVDSFARAKLETEADVRQVVSNAAASERAVMFINVNWAIMEPQKTRFAEFALAYQRKHPLKPVHFHFVDCTPVTSGYQPLESLPGWQELQEENGFAFIHGNGEIVWMKQGRVLHIYPILNFESVSELIKKTESLMLATKE